MKPLLLAAAFLLFLWLIYPKDTSTAGPCSYKTPSKSHQKDDFDYYPHGVIVVGDQLIFY